MLNILCSKGIQYIKYYEVCLFLFSQYLSIQNIYTYIYVLFVDSYIHTCILYMCIYIYQYIHTCVCLFVTFSSVQFSHWVVSDFLQPHESQHARPPCPSPTPRVHSDSRPSSQWCHPAISSSVIPFSSCPQSLPASESFPKSQLFAKRWPKYWSFSFSIIASKEIPGLISFRMDWLDLLAGYWYFSQQSWFQLVLYPAQHFSWCTLHIS